MLLKLYEKNNNPQDLQQVVDILNDGGLIIYPTDTMYAIGCHGLKERAIERICRIKEIDPRKNNLSIICYDLSSISEYAKVDNNTFKLMKRNLPCLLYTSDSLFRFNQTMTTSPDIEKGATTRNNQ